MGKTLMILEVSQKQDYIFASKQLKENACRSADIAYVTGDTFFRETAGNLYRADNMVFAGGGHTVLCFDDRGGATAFARRVSEAVLRQYPGMELFIKQLPYDEDISPGENLKSLSKALEAKKSLRQGAFARTSLGVEKLDEISYAPVGEHSSTRKYGAETLEAPSGWFYPSRFDELSGKDNFIAVIHIDGNAMGARVDKLYGGYSSSGKWDAFSRDIRSFSESIQRDFETAFLDLVEELIRQDAILERVGVSKPTLPIRPIILAGDDVCFVTAGSIGLECARIFLEKLSSRKNAQDQQPYAACAGVAIVHQKYPFHQAYDLAEQLCSNAKKFGSEIDASGRVSAMDWHIEFGQLKGGLSELREDLATEDGNRLELRPVTVAVPGGIDAESITGNVRSYGFFRGMCLAMRGEYGKTARGKIKDLRTAFKQGEVESEFFLRGREVENLLYHTFDAEFPDEASRKAQFARVFGGSGGFETKPFREISGITRCLFFDAIELIDHCEFFGEVKA